MPIEPDPLTIYLDHDPEHQPDYELAAKHLKCMDGCVVVEILRAPSKIGSIYLPVMASETHFDDAGDPVAGFESSLGVVLQSGQGCWLKPGERVLVRDGDGLELSGATFGEYKTDAIVRLYGLVAPEADDTFVPPPGYIEELPWEESIIAVLSERSGYNIGNGQRYCPTGRNILLLRDEVVRKIGMIELPDVALEDGPSHATVVAVGELVNSCKVGDRVLYHPLGKMDFFDRDHRNLRIIRERAVFAVIP